MEEKIIKEMEIAKEKAWKSLAGYKFWMFGYYAARWVSLNRFLKNKHHNPFRDLVDEAREVNRRARFSNQSKG